MKGYMTITRKIAGTLGLVSALNLANACSADDAQTRAALQGGAEDIVAAGAVGVQAELWQSEQATWVSAGVADLTTSAAVPRDGRFRIGSVTKVFVAATTLKLVEEGTLSLDDTVEQRLPGLVNDTNFDPSHITLRQLLQHTSGLPDYASDIIQTLITAPSPDALRAAELRVWQPEELVALALAHGPTGAPGERFSYSNTNYILVGMMLESATGQTWEQLVASRILQPLGLRATSTPGTDPSMPPPFARGYETNPDNGELIDVTEISVTSEGAAGAMISTTADLHTFMTALLDGRVLNAAMLAEMQTTVPGDDRIGGARYGLGLMQFPVSCGAAWGHDGGVFGYQTRLGVLGERAVAISMTGPSGVTAPAFEPQAERLVDTALCGL